MPCDLNDFEPYDIYDTQGRRKGCVRFNTGRRFPNQSESFLQSTRIGWLGGLHIYLYMPKNDFINYHISDPKVSPVYGEVYRFLDGGLTANIVISKMIESKQGDPYNDCRLRLMTENDHDSYLFKQIIRANYTYRQVSCYDLCYYASVSEKCDCSFTGNLIYCFRIFFLAL